VRKAYTIGIQTGASINIAREGDLAAEGKFKQKKVRLLQTLARGQRFSLRLRPWWGRKEKKPSWRKAVKGKLNRVNPLDGQHREGRRGDIETPFPCFRERKVKKVESRGSIERHPIRRRGGTQDAR